MQWVNLEVRLDEALALYRYWMYVFGKGLKKNMVF